MVAHGISHASEYQREEGVNDEGEDKGKIGVDMGNHPVAITMRTGRMRKSAMTEWHTHNDRMSPKIHTAMNVCKTPRTADEITEA